MDIKFTTFLYSKYSNTCKNFFGLVENIPPEIKENMKFTSLCIDNEKIRKNVLKSKLDIKNVPCILIIYNDGRAEKFEGVDAFKWGNEILFKIEQQKPKLPLNENNQHPQYQTNNQHPPQQMNNQHPPQQMNNQLPPQQMNNQHPPQQMNNQHPPQQMNNSKKTHGPPPSHNIKNIKEQMDIAKSKNEDDEYEEEYEEELPKPSRKKNKKSQPPNFKEKTSVDDLLSDSDNENEHQNIISNNNKEPPKSANTIKKESLMNTAMAMQKAREVSDKNLKIPLNGDR